MIPKTIPNPFKSQHVGRGWSVPPGNVPDLHKPVLDRCRQLLREVRESEAGTSLLIRGEAGSGKSHLINQLRSELYDDPSTFVVRVPLEHAYVGQVWRFVRKAVTTELLKKQWHPNEPELCGLVRVLQNRFSGWSPAPTSVGLIGMLTGSNPAGSLQNHLDEFASEFEICYELRTVLPLLWNRDTKVAKAAAYWLEGKTLGEVDLKRLGLPPVYPNDFELEQTARDVVLSLLRLAGSRTTILFCFDEVEALLTGTQDREALRSFTVLATDVIAEPGPRLVVTFVRPTTILALREHVENSNVQKMGQVESELLPLTQWEKVVQIVLHRLHTEPAIRLERIKYRDQFWPFGEAFLRDLFDSNRLTLTPRHLIKACMVEFDRLQRGIDPRAENATSVPSPRSKPAIDVAISQTTQSKSETEIVPLLQAPVAEQPQKPIEPPATEQFQRLWEKRRDHHLKHLMAIDFESVISSGLRWLAEVSNSRFRAGAAIDQRIANVNLVFLPADGEGSGIGVSLCHHDPQLLWRRLDKLIHQAQVAKAHGILGRLIILRSADSPVSDKSQERLDKLKRGGSTVLLLPKEQLAELAAYQELLIKSQTGVVTDNGRPISGDEYNAWVRNNLSSAVKELADSLFNLSSSPAVHPVEPKEVKPAIESPSRVKSTASAGRKR